MHEPLIDKGWFDDAYIARNDVAPQPYPPCQTRCRPIMIAEDPHRSTIYEQKFTFN